MAEAQAEVREVEADAEKKVIARAEVDGWRLAPKEFFTPIWRYLTKSDNNSRVRVILHKVAPAINLPDYLVEYEPLNPVYGMAPGLQAYCKENGYIPQLLVSV